MGLERSVFLLLGGCLALNGQTAECVFAGQTPMRPVARTRSLTAATVEARAMMPSFASTKPAATQGYAAESIDAFIFDDLKANQIAPAATTSDWEFIRRITLDLTGRIPAPERVLSFAADSAPNKRAKLVDELLAKPEWVDKWVMFLGDLYRNTAYNNSTALSRTPSGRNAFYQWIQDSLRSGKGYDQMATELLTMSTDLNGRDGPPNWLIGSKITNGPPQDTTDQMAAQVAETLLGIGHLNCVLCHNGRGHLDAVNLWGSRATRYQAWQFAAYLSHTDAYRSTTITWGLGDNVFGSATDYALNTVSGNRPARQPAGACDAGQACSFVAPAYGF